MTSREFAPWPESETSLATCRQNARTLQGKYQDAAAALDRAHQALTRIALRHGDTGSGACTTCYSRWNIPMRFPCPDYLDATGQRHD